MSKNFSNIDACGPWAVDLLTKLIAIPSFSKEEHIAAKAIEQALSDFGYPVNQKGNNIWAKSKNFQIARPTIMLNSHIDTVKPANGWDTDPFEPILENGKLTGLGSNDAGGCLVSLLATFIWADTLNLPFNLIFVASAEEEISGKMGLEYVIPELGKVDVGIVGEPTQMEMAVAEKGLMVLDAEVYGKSGHAARSTGINAIDLAIKEIEWFHTFKFPLTSNLLGEVKMTVTQINAGTQHNVIPDKCSFVVDVRTNEHYLNSDAFEIIKTHCKANLVPRSLRMNSSGIQPEHPLVIAAKKLQIECFGSPTTSDQAVITTFPTVKMGPGDSNRSHTANEYIFTDEITQGIKKYVALLQTIDFSK